MKIIKVDDFDRDSISDQLIAENVPDFYCNLIVEALNNKYSWGVCSDYFMAKPDTYELYTWEP